MKKQGLHALSVAFMCVGTVMGAGFASGREIWQFFGVFGNWAWLGVFVVGLLFIAVGVMTGLVSQRIQSADLGRIIVPGRNPVAIKLVGHFMGFLLFTVLITMSAAGGALFYQQFGLPRVLGGGIIIFFVTLTVLEGFGRVAGVFRMIMPLLVTIILLVCLGVLISDLPPGSMEAEMKPSPLASHWLLSAVLYLSYNVLAIIPIVATASLHAKSRRHAIGGAALGGLFLALLAFSLVAAMRTDPSMSQTMDMPMLAFAERLSPWVNILYGGVMLFAIYASATGNYYNFTLRLKASPKRKTKIILIACLGFLLGLMGFKNVVAYMFPLEGFVGIAIIVLLTINFVQVVKRKDKKGIDEDVREL